MQRCLFIGGASLGHAHLPPAPRLDRSDEGTSPLKISEGTSPLKISELLSEATRSFALVQGMSTNPKRNTVSIINSPKKNIVFLFIYIKGANPRL